jgi:hypothetical protein
MEAQSKKLFDCLDFEEELIYWRFRNSSNINNNMASKKVLRKIQTIRPTAFTIALSYLNVTYAVLIRSTIKYNVFILTILTNYNYN